MTFHHKPTNLPQARDRYLKAKERLLRRALHYGLLEHVALARASLVSSRAAEPEPLSKSPAPAAVWL